jgi:alkylated DNA repair dioxygenase AlkB
MAFIDFIDRTERFVQTADQVHAGPVRAAHTSKPWIRVHSVPGFGHLRAAVTPKQLDELVRLIDAEPERWEANDRLMRRYYGYRYYYQSDSLSQVDDGALPPWLVYWSRYIRERRWMSGLAQQVTIQKYDSHNSIAAHRDSTRCFGPEIVTISLVSSCEFWLTHARGRLRLSRWLEPGDITVLKGDARTVWRHEILQHCPGSYGGLAWRRLSVTFRAINAERLHGSERP